MSPARPFVPQSLQGSLRTGGNLRFEASPPGPLSLTGEGGRITSGIEVLLAGSEFLAAKRRKLNSPGRKPRVWAPQNTPKPRRGGRSLARSVALAGLRGSLRASNPGLTPGAIQIPLLRSGLLSALPVNVGCALRTSRLSWCAQRTLPPLPVLYRPPSPVTERGPGGEASKRRLCHKAKRVRRLCA